ncbi:hypothetical protein [Qipengyuania sp. 902]|uniref:hypothetical protein n=1 Tax=Qipengyuania sp. 902 TaxID=3417565 RepID=UPI003EB8F3DB
MNRTILTSGFAIATLLTALGVSQGMIDVAAGETLLIVFPALAIATIRPGKCCASLKGVFS